jgi:zinc protease
VFDRRGHDDATRPLLQLQLMAAYATDPGYRPEAEELFHQGMANLCAARRHAGIGARRGARRHPVGQRPALYPATAASLPGADLCPAQAAAQRRLAHGALEIALVGDVDEAAAIADVARTFGALPARDPAFGAWTEQRQRRFAAIAACRWCVTTARPIRPSCG